MAEDDKDGIGNILKDRKLAVLLITAAAASLLVTVYHLLSSCFGNPRRRVQFSGAAAPGITDRILAPELIPSHKYRGGGDGGDDDVCAVCLGEFEVGEELRALPVCSHAFHAPCIDTWLSSRATCPVCRADATPSPNPAAEETVTGQVEVVVDDRGVDQHSRR